MEKTWPGTILVLTFSAILILIAVKLSISLTAPSGQHATPAVTADQPIKNVEIPDQPLSSTAEATHILLAGIDGSSFEFGRTDSIILATLNPATNTVKLTSFMRDLYVEIPGHSYNKINAAYAFGGIDLLIGTLRRNFGLVVEQYIVVNYDGFEGVVDLLGGVDIEIKDYEISRIHDVSKPGLQHLDGQQTLDYCRIRYAGNSDYERTERQRRVLALLAEKVKQMPVSSYYRLYNTLRPLVDTNLSLAEILKLGYHAYSMQGFSIETLRVPADDAHVAAYVDQMAVLIPDLQVARIRLQQFLSTVPDAPILESISPQDETDMLYPPTDSPLWRQSIHQAESPHYGIVSIDCPETSR